MTYDYICNSCKWGWEDRLPVEFRDAPTTMPCPSCGEYEVIRMMSAPMVKVPEGGCGNAKNGYSSTHGDSENFKARDRGEGLPYDK